MSKFTDEEFEAVVDRVWSMWFDDRLDTKTIADMLSVKEALICEVIEVLMDVVYDEKSTLKGEDRDGEHAGCSGHVGSGEASSPSGGEGPSSRTDVSDAASPAGDG